jgi:hypothetical protein
MREYVSKNRDAWEYDAYNFWVKQLGQPSELAKEMMADPRSFLRKHAH